MTEKGRISGLKSLMLSLKVGNFTSVFLQSPHSKLLVIHEFRMFVTANPRIQVLRAKFSEITNASINRAIANLTQPDRRMSDAVQARQELDLRIGM